jgi:hypothetical protein
MLRSDDETEHRANGVPDGETGGTASASGQKAGPATDHALPPVCARVSAQLPALHAGTLDVAATQAALDHVAGCRECAARFERVLTDVYRLIREVPSTPRDLGLRATLYARIAADRSGHREQRTEHAEGETAPMTSRDDAVGDVNTDDTADTEAATAGTNRSTPAPATMSQPPVRTDSGRRLSRWLTSVAAVLVVALMAATLLTHLWGQRPLGRATATATATAPTVVPTGTSGGTQVAQVGPCTPKQTTVNLPDRATIFDLTMTSPTEGWLVGAIFNTDFKTTQAGMILHLSHCQWQPVSDPLPNAFLDSISMLSPTEGWVTGYTQSGDNYLLHFTHGHWQQVTAPYQATDGSYFGGIKMLSPDEGWLVVNSKSSFQPPIWSLLLHYQHGTWSQVTVPIPTVYDFAPIGPDELWIIGNSSTLNRQDSTLAHYRAGQWTTTPAPGHVLLYVLRLLSPTDGYAVGWQPQPTNSTRSSPPPAAVLQFDGTAWKPIQTGADVAAQSVVVFDHRDGWAFVQPPSSANLPNAVIGTAQHEVGGHWQTVPWPFSDVIAIGTVVRVSPGEYWASALHQAPPYSSGDFRWGLLHYVDGMWTAYSQR